MRQQQGFTLIQLLVVIAIIAILASLAIPQYLSYQRKAKVSSYAEPIARGCLMDLVAWCMENARGSDITIAEANVTGSNSPGRNCQNTTVSTAGGDVTLNASGDAICRANGTLEYGTATDDDGIRATLSGVSDFRARCFAANNSVRCTVEPQ